MSDLTADQRGFLDSCERAADQADAGRVDVVRGLSAEERGLLFVRLFHLRGDPVMDKLLAALSTPTTASRAAHDVLAERQRQISVEGWTPEHDDEEHPFGQLALAAASYAAHAGEGWDADAQAFDCMPPPNFWPWDGASWKPKNQRSSLVRAAALLLAEIERLDRAALSQSTGAKT